MPSSSKAWKPGGRNQSTTPLSVLLPATVDAIHPVPVIAAGGIADGRGLAAALDLGAQGVSLGTRFLCSTESQADPGYKQRVARAHASETVLTTLFDLEWPDTAHRVLQNKTIQTWQEAGSPPAGERPGEGEIVGRMPVGGQTTELGRYSVLMPLAGFAGDLDDQVLYCGQSCALINTIQPADEIMSTMIHDAEPLATHHTG
jgi:nitronate monooxygenase/enoyl-[acyl-carrier protein] reductase II